MQARRAGMKATLAQIAAALGMAKSGVAYRAEREAWPYTEEAVRGGKRRVYDPAALPKSADDVRAALQARAAEAVLTDFSLPAVAPSAGLPAGAVSPLPVPAAFSSNDLTDRQRLERDARSGVLAALRRLQVDSACTQEAAMTTLLTNA